MAGQLQSEQAERFSQLKHAHAKQLIPGDYLRTDYIEKLNESLSPLKAVVFDTPQLITVQTDERGLLLTSVFSFHEGGALFIRRADGAIMIESDGGDDTSNLQIHIIDPKHFILGYGRFKPMQYSYVKNAKSFVGRRVLFGKYKDDKGRIYVLGKDSKAIFPDRKFDYQVELDYVETHAADLFRDRSTNKLYAFKRQKNLLNIFATSGKLTEIVDEQPLLILKPENR